MKIENMPKELLSHLEKGNVSLFLGAGVSIGAKASSGLEVPSGAGLAERWHDKYLASEEGLNKSDLPLISSLIEQQGNLESAINDSLAISEPTKGHSLIPKFRWKAIFTTNPDNGLEVAAAKLGEDEKCQEVTAIVSRFDQSPSDSFIQVPYYKLHGCVERPEEGYVFSWAQYLTAREKRVVLLSEFKRSLEHGPMLIVGYGVNDDAIKDTIFSAKNIMAEKKYPIYLVQPKVPDVLKKLYKETYGIEIIEAYSNEFFEFLLGWMKGKNQSIRELMTSKTAGFQLDLLRDEGPRLKYEISSRYDSPKAVVSAENVTTPNVRFLFGKHPSWYDIAVDNDVRRDEEDKSVSSIKKWATDPKKTIHVRLLVGKSACGKSTLLKRIAFEADKLEKIGVIFLKPTREINVEEVLILANKTKKPLVLVVDDFCSHLNALNEFIRAFKSKAFNLYVLGADSVSTYNISRGLPEEKFCELAPLGELSDDEIQKFVSHLERKVDPVAFKGLDQAGKMKIYQEKSNKDLLAANLEIISGGTFDNFVANEFANIGAETARNAYKLISLFDMGKIPLPQYPLSKALNVEADDISGKIFSPLEGVIDALDIGYGSDDFLVVGRHPLISEVVADKLINDDDKFDLLQSLLPQLSQHRKTDAAILRYLAHHDNISRLFKDNSLGEKWYQEIIPYGTDEEEVTHQMALFLESKGRSKDAMETIDSLIARAPTTSRKLSQALIYLSTASDIKNDEQSMFLVRKAQETLTVVMRKKATPALFHVAISRYTNWIENKEKSNFVSEVAEYCQGFVDRVVNTKKNTPEVTAAIGRFYSHIGRLPEIEKHLKKGLERTPGNHKLRVLMAICWMNIGRDPSDVHSLLKEGMNLGEPTSSLLIELINSGIDAKVKFKELIPYFSRLIEYTYSPGSLNAFFAWSYLNHSMEGIDAVFALSRKLPPWIKKQARGFGPIREPRHSNTYTGSIVSRKWNFALISPSSGEIPKKPIVRSMMYKRTPEWFTFGQKVSFKLSFENLIPVAYDINKS